MIPLKMKEINPNFVKNSGEIFNTRKRTGDFGLELELMGDNMYPGAPNKRWAAKQDGSIPGGYEYITNGPVPFDQVREACADLKKFLKNEGSVFRPNYRASTHVHMNMGSEPWINTIGVIAAFTMIEPVMLRLCGPERDGNLFCISSGDCGDLSEYMSRLIAGVSSGTWQFGERGKYASLNIDPLFHIGSLEFRFFPSSWEPDEIHTWCSWLYNLRQMVRNCEDKTFRPLLDMARQLPIAYASSIIPDIRRRITNDTFPVTSFEAAMNFGVENAYEIYRVLWREIKNVPKPETKTTFTTSKKIFDDFVVGVDDAAVAAGWRREPAAPPRRRAIRGV